MSTIVSQIDHIGEPCDYCEVIFEDGDVVLEEQGPEEYCLVCTVCAQKHAEHAWRDDNHDDPDRDYQAEAFAILDGTSRLLPERAHLQALRDEGRTR